jgi:hypothetical protein
MVWDIRNKEVSGVNVTSRYVKKQKTSKGLVYFRMWDRKGGKRVVAVLNEVVKTKAGTADLNDMAELQIKVGEVLRVTLDGETRSVKVPAGKTVDLYWDQLK